MLKKGKRPEDRQESAPGKILGQESPASIPRPKTSEEKTIIGEHIVIEGNIRGEEHLVLEGSMKGNIELEKHNFSVGAKGRIEGEIHAQNIIISGQMIGNINTQGKVEITNEADFLGEIRAKSISVEDGAYFKGSIELDREPHRKTALKGKSPTLASPQPVNEPKIPAAKEAHKEN